MRNPTPIERPTRSRVHEGRHSRRIRTSRDDSRSRISADGHDVVVLSRRPEAAVARRCLGRRDPRQLATRDRRLRCRDQFGRPQCQLPVHRRESRGDPAVARVVDARRWTGDRDGGPQATGVAASEHRDDLCASIRQSERRVLGHSRRRRTERTRAPGDSASTSHGRGSAPSKRPLPMELGRLRFGRL